MLLARSVDFQYPKEKLGPKFATISAHRLSNPIDRSTDVYGRTIKTRQQCRPKTFIQICFEG